MSTILKRPDNATTRLRPVPRSAYAAMLLFSTALMLSACASGEMTSEEADEDTVAELLAVQEMADDATLIAAEEDLRFGRNELARERLAGLTEAMRITPRARFAMAEAELGVGNADPAYNLYQSVMEEPGYRARALQGQGLAELTAGRDEGAGALLQQAVAEDATLWRAWNALGRYYDNREEWNIAEESYARALTLEPDSPSVLNNQGISFMRQGRYAEAEAMFRRSLSVDPRSDLANGNLRLAVAWQGRYGEALNNVPAAEAPNALNNVGYIAMMNGDYATSERLLAQAIEMSPTFHAEAHANLNRLRALQGQPGVSQPTTLSE
ncbi:MAG: tetratricopeptide repeat protein [Rhodospirillaceae bacterium]|nr:tetratricopeptide repeat protein [Rhodospirillaceae bacterium]